ncbi:hypothetical protein EDB84DRAFT_603579 [Lactarius hengduanensis]|nr:hypothetical protein EDB84DRAFT_603579 [Lactarius hengduanensis]
MKFSSRRLAYFLASLPAACQICPYHLFLFPSPLLSIDLPQNQSRRWIWIWIWRRRWKGSQGNIRHWASNPTALAGEGVPRSCVTDSELSFARCVLLANENAVTNIVDLWVAAAMNVNEEVFEANDTELEGPCESVFDLDAGRNLVLMRYLSVGRHPAAFGISAFTGSLHNGNALPYSPRTTIRCGSTAASFLKHGPNNLCSSWCQDASYRG